MNVGHSPDAFITKDKDPFLFAQSLFPDMLNKSRKQQGHWQNGDRLFIETPFLDNYHLEAHLSDYYSFVLKLTSRALIKHSCKWTKQ